MHLPATCCINQQFLLDSDKLQHIISLGEQSVNSIACCWHNGYWLSLSIIWLQYRQCHLSKSGNGGGGDNIGLWWWQSHSGVQEHGTGAKLPEAENIPRKKSADNHACANVFFYLRRVRRVLAYQLWHSVGLKGQGPMLPIKDAPEHSTDWQLPIQQQNFDNQVTVNSWYNWLQHQLVGRVRFNVPLNTL